MDKSSKQCPICGEDNQCAIAAGKAPESCWCQAVTISPEVLASVPEADRARRCVCPACASGNTGEQ